MEHDVEKIYTWWFDSTSIFLRYFVMAGIGYMLFYVWKPEIFSGLKIQSKEPSKQIIRKEIQYSILTLSIHCGISWLAFYWQKAGITQVYLDLDTYGYPYFFLSILLMILIHDAYFYWTHRFMHLRGVFNIFHKVHHFSHTPTPWAAFSFHPLEAILNAGIIPLFVFLLPCHPYAIFAFLFFMNLYNVMGHLGYETFPAFFRKSKFGSWSNSATNHDIHHQRSKYNFGLYFTFWDRLMNTYSSEQKQQVHE